MTSPPNIADDLPFPILIMDRVDFSVTWANHNAQSWLGTSLKLLQGRPLSDIFMDSGELSGACAKVVDSMAPVFIHDYISKNRLHPNSPSSVTVFPSDKFIAAQFITASKPSPENLKGALTMSAMGRMLAHEIKNPLAGINGAAQLVRDDISSDEGQALVDLIEAEIARIRRLADRMERLGDQDPEMTNEINVHEIIRHARKIMEPAIGDQIMFSEHFDPSLPALKGDADTLIQAILNLIKNAAEAIKESGVGDVIMLETAYQSGVSRRIGSDETAQHLPVLLRVSDNGPGIDFDIQERLFQPFVSSKPSGQGLGLALVSKVAFAHGGIVDARSRNGWTEFSMRLPAPE